MPRILLVDDDDRILTSLGRTLRGDGYEVFTARSAEQALGDVARIAPDLLLTDVRMGGMDGVEFLKVLTARVPGLPVILMTAYGSLPVVSDAMREGAADFLMKPLDLSQLRRTLTSILDDQKCLASAASASSSAPADEPSKGLVGSDPHMVEIFKTIAQAAATRATVIIRGESGTGKELIARALHDCSPWSHEPFVAINCTAVPAALLESELFGHVRGSFTGASTDRRGRFALAGAGTIFLDEIGDTSLDFQSKLLRVLQEREFTPVGAEQAQRTEARIVAATHRDLEQLIARGVFREDLYYRLRIVEIRVPPLRERQGDILPLAEHLLKKVSQTAGRAAPSLSDDARSALQRHSWPGNVRELENTLTRAFVRATGGTIRTDHLELDTRAAIASASSTRLEAAMRDHITTVLVQSQWRKAKAARLLGISRPRLDRLIDKLHIAKDKDEAVS